MKQGVHIEVGVWAASMLFGATLLYAESAAPLRAQPIAVETVARYEIASSLSLPVPLSAAKAETAVASPEPAVLDQRLIANLLVDSIIQIESLGNPRMVGSKGERGLMQIKAATWSEVTRRHYGARISFARAFESSLNRSVGSAYLSDLQAFLAQHRASWKADERSLLLACYNAGPERVRQCGFDIRRLPASTRDYIARGSALHDTYLAEHNISTHQVRLAMDASWRAGGV